MDFRSMRRPPMRPPCPCEELGNNSRNSGGNRSSCNFIRFLVVLVTVFIAFLYWNAYNMHKDMKRLKDELQTFKKNGIRKDDPAQKLKELDKACSDTLKLLLKEPTGRADFALEVTGGEIVAVEAEPFTTSSAKSILGFKICEGLHGPTAIIQSANSPGECWAFKGQTASAIIKLIGHVQVDAVTLEHIPQNISPSGTIDTAPKDFKIWGLNDASKSRTKKLLGQFRYELDGDSLQTFAVEKNTNYYKFIEFEVVSNHGNDHLTCVYRLRVHGQAKQV